METLTILAFSLSAFLLGNEMPVGQTELGGFPVGYYFTIALLFIGFEMRKRLKNGRRRETVT